MFFRLQLARVLAAVCILSCTAFAGCSSRNGMPSGVVPMVPSSVSAPASHLYVWNASVPPAELDEYPTTGGNPILRIKSPRGISAGRTTIDGNGTLYINGGPPYAPHIDEYEAGSTKPFKTITKGVGSVIGLTTDEKNDLYLLDAGGPLVKYAPGATTPAFATYSGLCTQRSSAGPEVLTADRNGNAYVLASCAGNRQSRGVVLQYDGRGKVTRTISIRLPRQPYAITVDAAGRLYVAFAEFSGGIRLGVAEYDPGATKPASSFYVGQRLTTSGQINVTPPVVDDSSGTLFVTFTLCSATGITASKCTSAVYLFPHGVTTASKTLRAPAGTIYDAPVLDAAGNLYVEASSKSSVLTIERFAKDTWNGKTVVSGHKLLLGFAWPTIGSSRSSIVEAPSVGVGRP